MWVILAIAWDAACINKQPGEVSSYTRSDVTLRDFLTALIGSKAVELTVENAGSTQQERDFVQELLQRRVCFTHVSQLRNMKPSLGDLKMAASRMRLVVCAPRTFAIDALGALHPPAGQEALPLFSIQFQIKNREDFFEEEICFEKICEAAYNMSNRTLRGLDFIIHMGHPRSERNRVKFYIQKDHNRACIVLSTGLQLLTFQNAIQTVKEPLAIWILVLQQTL